MLCYTILGVVIYAMNHQRQGLRAIAATLPAATKPALSRRGLAAARLISDWAEIVGPALAASSLPDRVIRSRDQETATLVITVSPGLALELQHLEPLVIERINSHFGYRAITKLRLVQKPITVAKPPLPVAAKQLDPLSQARLEAQVATVGDDELRQALLALGRAVAVSRGA